MRLSVKEFIETKTPDNNQGLKPALYQFTLLNDTEKRDTPPCRVNL
jgi:hypothetical protein